MPSFISQFDVYGSSTTEADAQIDAFIDNTIDSIDVADGTIYEAEFLIHLYFDVTVSGTDETLIFRSQVIEKTDFKSKLKSMVSGFIGGVDSVLFYNSTTINKFGGKARITARYTV